MEIVVCSTSGKPIFHIKKSHDQSLSKSTKETTDPSHSFVSSIQGLLSFVSCTQFSQLEEIQTSDYLCIFKTFENITFAFIEEINSVNDSDSVSKVNAACVQRLIHLLYNQILFVLTSRGLDVLRKQPSYDLRELLSGTEAVTNGLVDRWLTDPSMRFQNMGIKTVRIPLELRHGLANAMLYEPPNLSNFTVTSTMVCGLLLASEKVVAIAQPNPSQFSIIVDDLLLLSNFVYRTPSLINNETWTPICLPSFNDRGFLSAYVVFLSSSISLILLSSQQSPEQFHYFQAIKAHVLDRINEMNADKIIHSALQEYHQWQPQKDLPFLQHFIYKDETTGICVTPEFTSTYDIITIETKELLLLEYSTLHHKMFPSMKNNTHNSNQKESISQTQVIGKLIEGDNICAANKVFLRASPGRLLVGIAKTDFRLYACFDGLVNMADADKLCFKLLQHLKQEHEVMINSL